MSPAIPSPAHYQSAVFETTPPPWDLDAIAAVCAEVGALAPRYIHVTARPGSRPGWCFDNVDHVIATEGGTKVHDFLFWSTAVYLNAEFHAVVLKPDDELEDPTIKVDGETAVLFAPHPDYPAGFNFFQRPANIRRRLYSGRPPLTQADDLIDCYSAKELRVQNKRAAAAATPLRDYVASRLPPDPLERTINSFLACANAAEGLFEIGPSGMTCRHEGRLLELEMRKNDLRDRIVRLWAQKHGVA